MATAKEHRPEGTVCLFSRGCRPPGPFPAGGPPPQSASPSRPRREQAAWAGAGGRGGGGGRGWGRISVGCEGTPGGWESSRQLGKRGGREGRRRGSHAVASRGGSPCQLSRRCPPPPAGQQPPPGPSAARGGHPKPHRPFFNLFFWGGGGEGRAPSALSGWRGGRVARPALLGHVGFEAAREPELWGGPGAAEGVGVGGLHLLLSLFCTSMPAG